MRILMFGNSFTFCNDMPQMLAKLLDAEVGTNLYPGAYLREQLEPDTEYGQASEALLKEKWDYVVLQDFSLGPVQDPKGFFNAVKELVKKAENAGAMPVLYATWAYKENTEKLASTGMTYNIMDRLLQDEYHEAARKTGALCADVGQAFTRARVDAPLYDPSDDYHPTLEGSYLAALVLASTIAPDKALMLEWHPEGMTDEMAAILQAHAIID